MHTINMRESASGLHIPETLIARVARIIATSDAAALRALALRWASRSAMWGDGDAAHVASAISILCACAERLRRAQSPTDRHYLTETARSAAQRLVARSEYRERARSGESRRGYMRRESPTLSAAFFA